MAKDELWEVREQLANKTALLDAAVKELNALRSAQWKSEVTGVGNTPAGGLHIHVSSEHRKMMVGIAWRVVMQVLGTGGGVGGVVWFVHWLWSALHEGAR